MQKTILTADPNGGFLWARVWLGCLCVHERAAPGLCSHAGSSALRAGTGPGGQPTAQAKGTIPRALPTHVLGPVFPCPL